MLAEFDPSRLELFLLGDRNGENTRFKLCVNFLGVGILGKLDAPFEGSVLAFFDEEVYAFFDSLFSPATGNAEHAFVNGDLKVLPNGSSAQFQ